MVRTANPAERQGSFNAYPEHYAQMTALENVTGHTMFCKTVQKMPVAVTLQEKVKIKPIPLLVAMHEEYLHKRQAALLIRKQMEHAAQVVKREQNAKSKGPSNKKRDSQTVDMF